ncbi:MAG: DNA starvation/stationary phase protection protein Dps [Steroidobacterales bacterium]
MPEAAGCCGDRCSRCSRSDQAIGAAASLEQLLNARLADALDLESASKQAHWNVKGPHFIALHQLFDQVHASIEQHVDVIAERITALGTVQAVASASSLAPYPQHISEGIEHLEALSDRLADFGRKIRAAIAVSDQFGDADTADLFTGISRDADKYLWLLEAHLQGKR